jgi:ATP-dependent helicase HrpB
MLENNYNLPITEIIPDVLSELEKNNTVIISAPPGAGKSTLLPLALLKLISTGQKIIMLEPRRLAAKSVAGRMAELLGETIGETVGYRIRFETCISNKTKIEVVTEGILTRQLQNNNSLEDIAIIIFDEFHERNLNSDLALALCREAQQILRPDLKIVIMSATLDLKTISMRLQAKVIESNGRLFPVKVEYSQDSSIETLSEQAAITITKALEVYDGDLLAFLPGEFEIKKCQELLETNLSRTNIYPLFGNLNYTAQQSALLPDKNGRRKVVLATSIAETSLTIEGIKIVVDSGFVRKSVFDSVSGLSKLVTTKLSVDVAEQRAGRAGRLEEGVCIRMWSLATHQKLMQHRLPEIEEADLTSLCLNLYNWGSTLPDELFWMSPPPKTAFEKGVRLLENLNAISDKKITAHGKAMLTLPCHPRIAHLLLTASNDNEKQLGCDVAAILEEKDPLGKDYGIDINLRIEHLRRQRRENKLNRKFQRINQIAEAYRKLINVQESNEIVDVFLTGFLIANAYPERIACAKPGNNQLFQLANGKLATVSLNDDLGHQPWLAIANMDMRETLGKIHLAAPLNPEDLMPLVKNHQNLRWDKKNGGIIAENELRIGNLILQSKPFSPNDENCIAIICEELKNEFESLLTVTDEFKNLQNRIECLRNWEPDLNLPVARIEQLKLSANNWLAPYLNGIRRAEELKKVNLKEALYHSLDYQLQSKLNELVPEKIIVPSGSNINVSYSDNGTGPAIYVRLQEVFGLEDTPSVNNGKIKAVMHLLSPGYKPVQVTSDLKSFWNNMYFEVKKELQRRYPKHAWPDDPRTAKPVAKGRSAK